MILYEAGEGGKSEEMLKEERGCHDLDFRVLDAISRSWGNGRRVMPICAGASWTMVRSNKKETQLERLRSNEIMTHITCVFSKTL